MESVKKSIDKSALHKREYDTRVNERLMQTTKGKVDTSITLDASLVDTENIRPIYDEEPMAEVQLIAECNVFATGQQHSEQPKFNNEGESERPRISKPRFASQVDVKHVLSKPVTPHYLPNVLESAVVKPNHVIASSESRKSSKNMPRFSSNDMVHNHYLKEAKNTTHDIGKIFESSTTKVDSEPPHGSNTDITNLHECIQNLDSSAGISINVQEEQTLDLNVGTPFNLKKERIKVWIKENVILGRQRIHGTTLIQ
ncbi:hypothetical protein Tco_0474909 [Tanacetum coccineum]